MCYHFTNVSPLHIVCVVNTCAAFISGCYYLQTAWICPTVSLSEQEDAIRNLMVSLLKPVYGFPQFRSTQGQHFRAAQHLFQVIKWRVIGTDDRKLHKNTRQTREPCVTGHRRNQNRSVLRKNASTATQYKQLSAVTQHSNTAQQHNKSNTAQ